MILILDMPRDDLRGFLDRFERWVTDVQEDGPAGGNPRLTMVVDDKRVVNEIAQFYFG